MPALVFYDKNTKFYYGSKNIGEHPSNVTMKNNKECTVNEIKEKLKFRKWIKKEKKRTNDE